jgi:flavin reductase (DIM6/NTAB) family NADH-FMN oxidoreductase RutF
MSIFNFANPEIYVITAAYDGCIGGQVTTWVTLATLVPEHLRVVTVISPRNFTFSLMMQSRRFVVNLLAAEQFAWLPLFGLESQRDINKFETIDYTTTACGIPLLPDTCGWVKCEIAETIDRGDRVVLVADVVAQTVNSTRQPLRRQEALAALPPEVTQALAKKRSLDIELDRVLIENWQAGGVASEAGI